MNVLLSILMLFGGMVDRKETSVIVIHHSAGEYGNAESFRKDHMTNPEKMWEDIGYHFVITNGNGGPDGKIQVGRDIWRQGAHAKHSHWGNMNPYSVGICLVGEDTFTEKQKIATILLVAKLCLKYNIKPSPETIRNHHEECPGPGLDIPEIIRETKRYFDYIKKVKALNNLQ